MAYRCPHFLCNINGRTHTAGGVVLIASRLLVVRDRQRPVAKGADLNRSQHSKNDIRKTRRDESRSVTSTELNVGANIGPIALVAMAFVALWCLLVARRVIPVLHGGTDRTRVARNPTT